MANHDMSILGAMLPDTSGDVFPSTLNIEMSLTNAKNVPCVVMAFPTGSDVVMEGLFPIPQNYVGTPKLVVRGILDGTPANVLAFGSQQVSAADSETADVAYETEDLANNSDWTGYVDEDMYEDIITLTPGSAYAVDDTILITLFRDDSVDTTTFNFLVTDVIFRYSDA